jgi:ornithine cyclodeaminase/alanine dehydrogenase-like protein (mu-crystallin family)
VNVAPREVLLTLGLSESDVDSMLARRSAEVQASPTSTAWVYDLLKEKSAGIASRISGSGRHYSADIVAVDRTGRAFKRVQIVVDTVPTTPQIVYRRDISDRGVPDVVKAFMNPAGAN